MCAVQQYITVDAHTLHTVHNCSRGHISLLQGLHYIVPTFNWYLFNFWLSNHESSHESPEGVINSSASVHDGGCEELGSRTS